MEQINSAIKIAAEAHDGQTDKTGKPYIWHPLTVASFCKSEKAKIAAVLHDVIEDTDVTAADLLKAGIDADVVDAVVRLSKNKGEELSAYYDRVAASDIATEVKFADMLHNSELSRFAGSAVSAEYALKITSRYAERMKILYGKPGVKEKFQRLCAPETAARVLEKMKI
ncbi:MAG: HD domain-containing protein [Clostridiaceae bacterium]|nr:HD domain-containing protein [Clostridiaceae bacterium]